MLKLIMNADDFGYSRGVNYGIIEAHQQGIVRSTTLMANMPAFEQAIALAKENTYLGVGVHLTITTGAPVLRTHKTIVNQQGLFIKVKEALKETNTIDLEEIRSEWFAQIRKVYASGIKPTHIDSHHHSHGEDALLPIAAEIANYYDLPMRIVKEEHRKKIAINQYGAEVLSVDFFDQDATMENLLNIIEKAKQNQIQSLEIMCHPALIDHAILNSSYNIQRTNELNILTTPGLEEHLRSLDVVLANFSTI